MSESRNSPESSNNQAQRPALGTRPSDPPLRLNAELSKIRHDLRISIGHAIGYCEMLLEDESVPGDFLNDLRKIHAGGRKCLTLINQCFHEDSLSGDRDLHQLCHELRTPVNHMVGYSEMLQERAVEIGRPDLISDLQKIPQAAAAWLGLMEKHLIPGAREIEPEAVLARSTVRAIAKKEVAAEQEAAAKLENTILSSEGGHLLVVDDDADNRELLSRRLQRFGFRISLAEDGPTALDRIGTEQFDLILLDMVMPGMDGLEVLKSVRQRLGMSELPIIVVTGRDSSQDIVQALQSGANDFITKPIDFSVALARTRTHLLLKKAQQQLKARIEEVQKLANELELRNAFIKQVFGRYLADDVVESLLETPQALELGGQKRKVTIVMSDLRGFTSIAERLAPEQVVEMLNVYLGAMVEVITHYQGTIDEFIGDAVMAVFGAPLARNNDAERAVACAIAMQRAMAPVNEKMTSLGVPQLEMGIGINTGEVVIGNIGSAKRAKYGVVGSQVNLAARIEAATVGQQILISESTAAELRPLLSICREVISSAKGIREPLKLYDVRGIRGQYALELPRRDETLVLLRDPFPVECVIVSENKQEVGHAFAACFRELSPIGGRMHATRALDSATNLRIRIPSGDKPGHWDLYAKVTGMAEAQENYLIRFTSVPPEAMAHLHTVWASEQPVRLSKG